MKTTFTLTKKLSIILFSAVLLLLNINAKAQCTASFVAYDSLGYVYFDNQSTGLGAGVTCTWTFGDGSTETTIGDTTHLYNHSGFYMVCLTISNFLGTCNDSFCDTVFVNTNSTGGMCLGFVNPYFIATDSLMYGIFNNTPIGSGHVYHWDFGDGTTSSVVGSTTHNYASNGNYTVCLTVYETGGAFDSCQYCSNISIGNCYSSFIAYDSAGTVYFQNTSVGSGITSTWQFGDGTSGVSIGDITHTYSFPGFYIVSLTISDGGTCNNTYHDTIFIPTASGGGSTACLGVVNPYFNAYPSMSSGVFYNTPSSSSGQVYHWDFGDGTTSSIIGSTSHNYTSNGTYTVCLTVYEIGGSFDSCQYCTSLTINNTPSPCDASFTIVQDSSNLFNYFIYVNNPISGPAGYYWNFGDGTTSTLQYPSHTYPSSGPYYICLTLADSSSMFWCVNTYCDSLEAGRSSTPITINVIPTGINESVNLISSFENYPNPFSENTTITYTLSKQENVELCVFDLLGNKVSSIESGNKNAGTHTINWNAENLNQGMYLLQLKAGNNSSTKKVIINK